MKSPFHRDICADPDNLELRLVCADWLQEQGDKRGQLIALQHAGSPEVEDFLEDNDVELLGRGLRRSAESDVSLDWGLGYLRGAEVRGESADGMAAALRNLLESPSSPYLQSLQLRAIRSTRAQPFDYGPAVTVLLAKGPKTLESLQIGKGALDYNIGEEIYAAFPRLRKPLNERWKDVRAGIATHGKRLRHGLPAASLPVLVEKVAAPADTLPQLEELLRGLKLEFHKKQTIGLSEAMRESYTEDSLDVFACALAREWQREEASGLRWCFDTLGALGGVRCAEFAARLLHYASHSRAIQVLRILQRINRGVSLYAVYMTMVHHQSEYARRREARDVLAQMDHSGRLHQLLDQCTPNEGRMSFGEPVAVFELRRMLERVKAGDRMSEEAFLRCIRHPLRKSLAKEVTWGIFANERGGERLRTCVRVDSEEELRDVEGRREELAESERIGPIHPAEMSEVQRGRWRDFWEQYQKRGARRTVPRALFASEQLTRNHIPLLADSPTFLSVTGLRGKSESFGGDLVHDFRARDWWTITSDYDDEELLTKGYAFMDSVGVSKLFERGWVEVCIELPWNRKGVQKVRTRPEYTDRNEVIHPVVLAEIAGDIASALGVSVSQLLGKIGPRKLPAKSGKEHESASPENLPEDPGLPQTGKYPFVEAAKSGRSKCCACGKKIDKGEMRVGIEREVDTGHFQGKVTAWCHRGCALATPELRALGESELAERLGE